MARARGEESDEMHNAMGQRTPRPRAASTVFFSMDDDGDVFAAPPGADSRRACAAVGESG